MPISARICGNTALKKALLDPCEALQAGRTVADSLRESRVFPGTVLQLLNVGEQTGALDSMLRKVANFYEDELEQAVANLLAAIQAVTIAFLGLGVGGVLISIYLPLLSLMGKLTR
jgi:type IV pilus assembly protein PilC